MTGADAGADLSVRLCERARGECLYPVCACVCLGKCFVWIAKIFSLCSDLEPEQFEFHLLSQFPKFLQPQAAGKIVNKIRFFACGTNHTHPHTPTLTHTHHLLLHSCRCSTRPISKTFRSSTPFLITTHSKKSPTIISRCLTVQKCPAALKPHAKRSKTFVRVRS